MTDQHSITPTHELVSQWIDDWNPAEESATKFVAKKAARWGWQQRDASVADELQEARDEELEACCEWVSQWCPVVGDSPPELGLRAARRPKPQSLAEEALQALKPLSIGMIDDGTNSTTIRRALKRLQELEGQS